MTENNENKSETGLHLPEAQFDRLSHRLAQFSDGDVQTARLPERAAIAGSDPEESRFPRPAGKMLLGSRVPAPDLSEQELEDALYRGQLFSSVDQDRRQSLSPGQTVASLCILAAGSAIALTAFMDPGTEPENVQQSAQIQYQAPDRVLFPAENPAPQLENSGPPYQPVMSLSPIDRELSALGSGVIRLVQNEGGGLSIQDVAGDAGEQIPLQISIDQIDGREYAFVMFRGLPDGFTLSSGFRVKQSWAVSLKDLGSLTLQSPDTYAGQLDLEVLLVKGRNSPVESRTMTVNIGGPAPDAVATTDTAANPIEQIPPVLPPAIAPVARDSAADRDPSSGQETQEANKLAEPLPRKLLIGPEEEAAMLERGLALLANGDVTSARLLLEHIAKKGSGKGALALGQTYDPVFFGSINALGGVQPDRDKAMEWYSIAAGLGQDAAKERLSALSSR